VGTWLQQWNCGLHASKTGAHVSYTAPFTGHNGAELVVVLIVVVLLAMLLRGLRGGGRKAATSR
jgi:hypothetical protein